MEAMLNKKSKGTDETNMYSALKHMDKMSSNNHNDCTETSKRGGMQWSSMYVHD